MKRAASVPAAEARSNRLPCTMSNTRLASSSFYNSRRRPPPLEVTIASVDVKTDVKMQSSCGRTIRPLPPLPNTASPVLRTRHQTPNKSSRRPRPLPSLPSLQSPLSDTSTSTCSSETSLCSTPSTSLEDLHDLQVARSVRFRPTLPRLMTNEKFLKSPPVECIDVYSPSIPMPPTPRTAKRKRVEKLRRHLGEPIPDDAVYDHRVSRSASTASQVLEKVHKSKIPTYVRAAVTAAKILDLSSCNRYEDEDEDDSDFNHGDSSASYDISCEDSREDEKDLDSQEDYTWMLENGTPFRTGSRRYTCKWVSEKRGRRETEADYKRIIDLLRVL
jgi:hypothetical protein